jgi:hypothetical protein
MVTRVRVSALLALALANCASTSAGEDELADPLAGRIAGEPRSCVSPGSGQGMAIIAPGTVGYRAGDTLWVSRLGPPCARVRPMDTLVVEAHGGRHCRGDPVRALPMGSRIAGPVCGLGDFVPYRRAG